MSFVFFWLGTVVLVLGGLTGILLYNLAMAFVTRWGQAGRKGYGYEHRGRQRLRTAARLFREHDLWEMIQ